MTGAVIGTVVRLQVQRSRLKPGQRGARVYDPSPLLEVQALELGPRGVVGHGGAEPDGVSADGMVLDVHHADHPDSRNVKLVNGLSLLPLAHYDAMRSRFGPHLIDGIAGESVLLDTGGPWTLDSLAGQLALETSGSSVLPLSDLMVAAPCIEFSRFCLGAGPDLPVGEVVQRAMADLSDGVRGFYATSRGAGRVEVGARLLRLPVSGTGGAEVVDSGAPPGSSGPRR